MPEPDPSDAQSIFGNALERPPAERAAYLDAACAGAPTLRAEIEDLLRAYERAAGFLVDDPAATRTDTGPGGAAGTVSFAGEPPAPADAPGGSAARAVLAGRYKLIERIGEGGMGAVWVAQQTEPIKRLVAVKLIKPGMDSKQVLVRFEAERQALALMDHPNIAKVLDAGAAPDGRPFFVMELVKGVPITQFCDERKLPPRERLGLFVPVCRAIQHAHQKGVIHRDIKPSNVLVALYDDAAVPKVIDFGVAKAAGEPLTDATLHTGFGAVVGTLQYMAPEQAALNNLDVDTRADVYALGALLYELLTGAPPLDRRALGQKGLLEMLRAVREDEPPKPSTRLSGSAEAPAVAAARGTDPGRLAGLLRTDLDWVVMKALEKDRNRRYETAAGFAADVERYLAGEPVQAAPPSVRYRAGKFVRRHRAAVAAAALGFVLVALGAAGTAVGLVREERARRDAAEKQAEVERDARQQAQVLTDKLRRLLAAADPDAGGGPEMTVRELLDRQAPTLWADLADRPEVEAELRFTVGRAYDRLIDSDKAIVHLEAAVRLRRAIRPLDAVRLAEVLTELATAYVNDPIGRPYPRAEGLERLGKAVSASREAVDLLRGAGEEGTGALSHALRVYAGLLYEQADKAAPEARDWEPFRATTREALEVAQRCPPGERDRSLAEVHELRSVDFRDLRSEYPAAIRELRTAIEYRERDRGKDHLYTARARSMLAMCHLDAEDYPAAEEQFRAALGGYDKVFAGRPNPYSAQVDRHLVSALAWQYKDADVAALLRKYPPDAPAQFMSESWAVWAPHVWGWVCLQRGDYADAESHFRTALDAGQKYAADDWSLAATRYWLAYALGLQDKRAEAAAVVRVWRDAALRVAAGGPIPPDVAVSRLFLSDPHSFYLDVLIFSSPADPVAAKQALEWSARRMAEVAGRPLAERWGQTAGRCAAAWYLGDFAAVVPTARDVVTGTPVRELLGRRSREHFLADSLEKSGNLDGAEKARKEAVEAVERELGADHPETASRRVARAAFLIRQKRHKDAVPELVKAYAALSAHPQASGRALTLKRFDIAQRLAAAYEALGEGGNADEWRARVPPPLAPLPRLFWPKVFWY